MCHFPAQKQGCARDFLSRDRDETRDPCLQDQDETETFKILSETRPRRDVAASETLAKTLSQESRELQRLAKTFSVTCGETH